MRHHFLLTRLARIHKCEINVLSFDGLGASRHSINPELVYHDGIQLIHVESLPNRNPALYYVLNSKQIWDAISRVIEELHIDVVVNSNILPGAIAANLARRRKVPLVYDLIEYYPQSAAAYFQNSLLKTLAASTVKRLMYYIIHESDAVVTVSDSHAKMVRTVAPSKLVRVVPNGVDLRAFKPSEEAGMSKSDSKKLRLVYVGSVDEWLDLGSVVKAIANVKADGLLVSLTVVGGSHGNNYLDQIKALVKSHGLEEDVVFEGFVPYDKIPEYINAADVAVAPYRNILKNDVTPLKVLEYLACRKIVLCTKIPEIRRRFGTLLYFYEGAEELTRMLKSISQNRGAFRQKDGNVRRFLLTYSWDNLAAKYYQIMKTVVQGKT
jgi:glycosyltransferase involved in cell wall biosynthesis